MGLLYKNIPYDAIEVADLSPSDEYMTLYEMFRKGYMKARVVAASGIEE